MATEFGDTMDGFLFDLGNVLVHFSHERMCQQMGELVGIDGERMATLLTESQLHFDFERGKFDDAEFHRRFESLTGSKVDRGRLFQAGSDIFAVNKPMVDVVRGLKAQDKRLVLLSNTCKPHIEWIARKYDVLGLFDELVLSFEAKAAKPEPEIFDLALAKLELPATRCLYTDDIASYVDAGRRSGMHGVVYTGVGEWIMAAREMGVSVGE